MPPSSVPDRACPKRPAAPPCLRTAIAREDLPARPEAVRTTLGIAVAAILASGFTRKQAGLIELILAELLNNIVEHAYRGRDDGTITLRITRHGDHLRLHLRDRGIGFAGGHIPGQRVVVLDVPRSDLPEGGFGWNLIHCLAQAVAYRRIHDVNHLVILVDLAALG